MGALATRRASAPTASMRANLRVHQRRLRGYWSGPGMLSRRGGHSDMTLRLPGPSHELFVFLVFIPPPRATAPSGRTGPPIDACSTRAPACCPNAWAPTARGDPADLLIQFCRAPGEGNVCRPGLPRVHVFSAVARTSLKGTSFNVGPLVCIPWCSPRWGKQKRYTMFPYKRFGQQPIF